MKKTNNKELLEVEVVKKALRDHVINSGGYANSARLLSDRDNKFTASFISMVEKDRRVVTKRLARALGYEHVSLYIAK